MTVSAIVIGHANRGEVDSMVKLLRMQTRPPEEIIATVCCMSVEDLEADVVVLDRHYQDYGHSKCDLGIRIATQEYVGFFSCDDYYEPHYLERMLQEDADIIHCDFLHHGAFYTSVPAVNNITRGCYLVRSTVARPVGYNHTVYHADGLFIEDLKRLGATDVRVPELLHHNR